MGKKKSGSGGGGEKQKGGVGNAREFVLRVAMHCHCNGCMGKIRSAVKDLTLLDCVAAVDQSAVGSKGEVRLLATVDPEKLRRRLHKATGKNVELLLPETTKAPSKAVGDGDGGVHAAATANIAAVQQALLNLQLPSARASQLQLGQGHGGGWNAAGSYGPAAAQAYPWGAAQPAGAYSYSSGAGGGTSYPGPAGGWGPYAYPAPAPAPAQLGHGAYYGGAPAWHGHGY